MGTPRTRAGIVVVLLAVVGASAFVFWPRSPEARIRRAMDGILDGFADTDAGDITNHFTEDYVDVPSDLTRDSLRGILVRSFISDRLSDGTYPYRARIVDETISIELDADATRARVRFTAVFDQVDAGGENPRPAWQIETDCDWIEDAGRWRIDRSRWRTSEGRPVF